MRMRGAGKLSLLLSIGVICAVFAVCRSTSSNPVPQSDQQYPQLIRSTQGRDLFRAYCASCHGSDGKGHGPAAGALKSEPPDLSLLARRNGGQFPSADVRRVITGDDVVVSHGSRQMPIWGPIFHQIEEDVDRGNVRLDNLVKYLESIQQK